MSDIVLLSHHADEVRVHSMVDALIEDRQDVEWLRVGNVKKNAADKSVTAAIEDSRCVVLIWSAASAAAASTHFHALARKAVAQANAICVLIDSVTIPSDIGACSIYDMRGRRGAPQRWRKWLGGNLYMRDLVTGAKYKVAGRDPPPPGAPRQMLVRHAVALIPAIFSPLGVLVGALATLLGLWSSLGFSDRPSANDTKVWELVAKDDCSQLRKFLSRNSGNHFAEEAQRRLDGAERKTQTIWERAERLQPLYVGEMGASPSPNESVAAAEAKVRATAAAKRSCEGLARAGQAKLVSVQIGETAQSCSRSFAGHICSIDGEAICRLSEPRDVEVETCAVE